MQPEVGSPATEDDERWKKEADDLRHNGLAAVREAAGNWLQTIALILGAFSAVAFVKGPESITDLDSTIARTVTVIVLTAALLVGSATWLAAVAAQGSPRVVSVLTGPKLRDHVEASYDGVTRLLWWSRMLTVVAALAIAAGTGLTWLAPAPQAKETTNLLVVSRDGTVACLPVRDGTVANDAQRAVLQTASAVQLVKTCP